MNLYFGPMSFEQLGGRQRAGHEEADDALRHSLETWQGPLPQGVAGWLPDLRRVEGAAGLVVGGFGDFAVGVAGEFHARRDDAPDELGLGFRIDGESRLAGELG